MTRQDLLIPILVTEYTSLLGVMIEINYSDTKYILGTFLPSRPTRDRIYHFTTMSYDITHIIYTLP